MRGVGEGIETIGSAVAGSCVGAAAGVFLGIAGAAADGAGLSGCAAGEAVVLTGPGAVEGGGTTSGGGATCVASGGA